jgi:acyl-CoA thioester hydrolase
MEFSRIIQIRWSDLDPNFHVRHSVYYDWGAFCRIECFNQYGLTADVMMQNQIGPILFREECVFRREIKNGDAIRINMQITKSRKDYSRWSIQHQITKDEEKLCAVLTVDGAWMNLAQRKLMSPPEQVHHIFEQFPKGEAFEWMAGG